MAPQSILSDKKYFINILTIGLCQNIINIIGLKNLSKKYK